MTSSPTPAVLPDARACEFCRSPATTQVNDFCDKVDACARCAAIWNREDGWRSLTPPASDAAVPAGEDGKQAFRSGAAWAVSFQAVRGRAPDLNDVDAVFAAAAPKVASDTCPFCTGASEYQGSPEDAFCERHLRLYRKASAA